MKRSMQLSLRAGERLYINGAVLRVDRKVTIELLNDATFLLENHVLQIEDATTPLKRLYFVLQTMLMDPATAQETLKLFQQIFDLVPCSYSTKPDESFLAALQKVRNLVEEGRPFEAMRMLRGLYVDELPLLDEHEREAEAPALRKRAG